jgi:hypothetical protein
MCQYVQRLEDHFSLILIDSLGHGKSSRSTNPAHYCREQRAGEVSAVLDQLGHKQAAFLGYSMGGWTGMAMAMHAPERLTHLIIAGWDVRHGTKEWHATGGMGNYQPTEAEALALQGLTEIDGAVASLEQCGVQFAIMCGKSDPYFSSAKQVAESLSCDFTQLKGDHVSAFTNAKPVADAALAFITKE